jgi:hypothetical protein
MHFEFFENNFTAPPTSHDIHRWIMTFINALKTQKNEETSQSLIEGQSQAGILPRHARMDAYVKRMEAAVLMASKALEKLRQENEKLAKENQRLRQLVTDEAELAAMDLELAEEEEDNDGQNDNNEDNSNENEQGMRKNSHVAVEEDNEEIDVNSTGRTTARKRGASQNKGTADSTTTKRKRKNMSSEPVVTVVESDTEQEPLQAAKAPIRYTIETGWKQKIHNVTVDLTKLEGAAAATQGAITTVVGDLVLCRDGIADGKVRFVDRSHPATNTDNSTTELIDDADKKRPTMREIPNIYAVKLLLQHLCPDSVHAVAVTMCKYPPDLVCKALVTHLETLASQYVRSYKDGTMTTSSGSRNLSWSSKDAGGNSKLLWSFLRHSNFPVHLLTLCDLLIEMIVSMATRVHHGASYANDVIHKLIGRTLMMIRGCSVLQVDRCAHLNAAAARASSTPTSSSSANNNHSNNSAAETLIGIDDNEEDDNLDAWDMLDIEAADAEEQDGNNGGQTQTEMSEPAEHQDDIGNSGETTTTAEDESIIMEDDNIVFDSEITERATLFTDDADEKRKQELAAMLFDDVDYDEDENEDENDDDNNNAANKKREEELSALLGMDSGSDSDDDDADSVIPSVAMSWKTVQLVRSLCSYIVSACTLQLGWDEHTTRFLFQGCMFSADSMLLLASNQSMTTSSSAFAYRDTLLGIQMSEVRLPHQFVNYACTHGALAAVVWPMYQHFLAAARPSASIDSGCEHDLDAELSECLSKCIESMIETHVTSAIDANVCAYIKSRIAAIYSASTSGDVSSSSNAGSVLNHLFDGLLYPFQVRQQGVWKMLAKYALVSPPSEQTSEPSVLSVLGLPSLNTVVSALLSSAATRSAASAINTRSAVISSSKPTRTRKQKDRERFYHDDEDDEDEDIHGVDDAVGNDSATGTATSAGIESLHRELVSNPLFAITHMRNLRDQLHTHWTNTISSTAVATAFTKMTNVLTAVLSSEYDCALPSSSIASMLHTNKWILGGSSASGTALSVAIETKVVAANRAVQECKRLDYRLLAHTYSPLIGAPATGANSTSSSCWCVGTSITRTNCESLINTLGLIDSFLQSYHSITSIDGVDTNKQVDALIQRLSQGHSCDLMQLLRIVIFEKIMFVSACSSRAALRVCLHQAMTVCNQPRLHRATRAATPTDAVAVREQLEGILNVSKAAFM